MLSAGAFVCQLCPMIGSAYVNNRFACMIPRNHVVNKRTDKHKGVVILCDKGVSSAGFWDKKEGFYERLRSYIENTYALTLGVVEDEAYSRLNKISD